MAIMGFVSYKLNGMTMLKTVSFFCYIASSLIIWTVYSCLTKLVRRY